MAYRAKILADSLAQNGKRLTTFQITIPKFIQAEVNTHRMCSRSSASSRAIPIERVLEQVRNDPVLPVWWGKAQAGMSAREELGGPIPDAYGIAVWNSGDSKEEAKYQWLRSRDVAVAYAEKLQGLGLHKQIANRIIEPWMFVDVIISATEWENFFRLRCHTDAQPEFKHIAEMMRDLLASSAPVEFLEPDPLSNGRWHLPLITEVDRDLVWDKAAQECFCHDDPTGEESCVVDRHQTEYLCRISAARCARVSYHRQNDERPIDKDLELAQALIDSMHMSPLEHVATPLPTAARDGNFFGWRQYRHDIDPFWIE